MEITEIVLALRCKCSIPILRKWLCRSEFAHIERTHKTGKFGRKLRIRYQNVSKADIENLKEYIFNSCFRNGRVKDAFTTRF